jgi:HSP20 family molecular chaperone IbpA
MKRTAIFQKMWAGLDRMLLAAVFVLLGAAWYAAEKKARAAVAAEDGKRAEAPEAEAFWRRPPAPGRAVEGLRVSTGQGRMTSIARSMVESGWERLPCSPAMDMREDGKVYEILFALPDGVPQDGVRVTAQGSVLTLAVKTVGGDGQAMLRRVRLPCNVERADHVTSTISNNVLRVRIQPAG